MKRRNTTQNPSLNVDKEQAMPAPSFPLFTEADIEQFSQVNHPKTQKWIKSQNNLTKNQFENHPYFMPIMDFGIKSLNREHDLLDFASDNYLFRLRNIEKPNESHYIYQLERIPIDKKLSPNRYSNENHWETVLQILDDWVDKENSDFLIRVSPNESHILIRYFGVLGENEPIENADHQFIYINIESNTRVHLPCLSDYIGNSHEFDILDNQDILVISPDPKYHEYRRFNLIRGDKQYLLCTYDTSEKDRDVARYFPDEVFLVAIKHNNKPAYLFCHTINQYAHSYHYLINIPDQSVLQKDTWARRVLNTISLSLFENQPLKLLNMPKQAQIFCCQQNWLIFRQLHNSNDEHQPLYENALYATDLDVLLSSEYEFTTDSATLGFIEILPPKPKRCPKNAVYSYEDNILCIHVNDNLQHKLLFWLDGKIIGQYTFPLGTEIRDLNVKNSMLVYEQKGYFDTSSVYCIDLKDLLARYTFTKFSQSRPLSISSIKLHQARNFFNSSDYDVTRYETYTKDGITIPYLVSFKKDGKKYYIPKPRPAILNVYGGFCYDAEFSCNPTYIAYWLNLGGCYVHTFLRGELTFGLSWSQAGMNEQKFNTFEDVRAITQSIFDHQISSPDLLIIEGCSNGGMVASVAMIQNPSWYKGVIAEKPVTALTVFPKYLEMAINPEYRYHLRDPVEKAIQYWLNDFGDEDNTSKYSPLDTLELNAKYPPCLIISGGKDNIVHPTHPRSMAYRMQQLNNPTKFIELPEADHFNDLNEWSYTNALKLCFMYSLVMPHLETKAKTRRQIQEVNNRGFKLTSTLNKPDAKFKMDLT